MSDDLINEFYSWRDCKRCRLHITRRQCVLGSGSIPCEILIIGEAPGKSDDLLGYPFFGPSGRLLECVMAEAYNRIAPNRNDIEHPKIYLTNCVACRPTDIAIIGDNRAPTRDEILQCRPRLELLSKIARPILTILMGKVAERECSALFPGALAVEHPASILHRGGYGGPAYQKWFQDWRIILETFYDMQERRSENAFSG